MIDSSHGFTLIELLVVITIIVVLLALLTPALDRAIYQAEMVVCASTQRALAGGATLYASAFKRRYPARVGIEEWEYIEINKLASPITADSYDMRRVFDGFIQVNKMMDCPFSEPVDWEATDPETAPYVNYGWWFGTRYVGYSGMMKMGDRFTWPQVGDRIGRFDVMTADYDVSEGQCSHPDANGVYVNKLFVNTGSITGLFAGADKITASVWTNPGTENLYLLRGWVDLNFTHQDLSASRSDMVLPHDADMDRVPHRPSGSGPLALIPRGR